MSDAPPPEVAPEVAPDDAVFEFSFEDQRVRGALVRLRSTWAQVSEA